MNTQRMAWLAALVVVVTCGSASNAWGGESVVPLTVAKRIEFYNNYHTWSPRERREALKLLLIPEYRDDATVGRALYDIALNDPDPQNRLDAFVGMCSWRERDGRLAYRLARAFKLELELAIKPKMAQAMTQLKFKKDILNELIVYACSPGVDFPYVTAWNNGYGNGNGNRDGRDAGYRGYYNYKLDNYRILVEAINKLSGQRFVLSGDTTRQMFDWWRLNAIDFEADDIRLAQKVRAEGEGPAMMAVAEAQPGKLAVPVAGILERKEQEPQPRVAKGVGREEGSRKVAGRNPALDEDEVE